MSENDTPKLEIFALVKERCTLANMNIRTEMHGDERQRAVDLQFEFSGANNLLSKLHPDMRHSFYKQQDTKDMLTEDHTPVLRFPLMGGINWDLEIPRTRLQLHGDSPADDVVLGDGKTNKFKLQMLDGGTVKWSFRVQFSNPSDKAIAGLSHFLNDTVPVSLECRSAEEEGDNFDKVEQLSLAPMSEARLAAEDLFASPSSDLALATQEDDPDFCEVRTALPDGDEPHPFAPADDLDSAPTIEAASNVEPIGRKRTTRKVAGGSLE